MRTPRASLHRSTFSSRVIVSITLMFYFIFIPIGLLLLALVLILFFRLQGYMRDNQRHDGRVLKE